MYGFTVGVPTRWSRPTLPLGMGQCDMRRMEGVGENGWTYFESSPRSMSFWPWCASSGALSPRGFSRKLHNFGAGPSCGMEYFVILIPSLACGDSPLGRHSAAALYPLNLLHRQAVPLILHRNILSRPNTVQEGMACRCLYRVRNPARS